MSAPRIGLTQIIDASPAAVWAVVTDIGSAASTLSEVDAIELLTDGPYAVGTRWRETRSMWGMSDTMEMEVSEVEPERSTVVLSEYGDVTYHSGFTLRPRADGGTELTMTFTAEQPPRRGLKALLSQLLGQWGLAASRKVMEQDLLDIADASRTRR